MKEKEKKIKFPKDFFAKKRPEVNLKDALKDVIPVEWVPKTSILNDKKKSSNNPSIIADFKYI